jgi:hypothetical protein
VRVPVIDLDKYAGGLTLKKADGFKLFVNFVDGLHMFRSITKIQSYLKERTQLCTKFLKTKRLLSYAPLIIVFSGSSEPIPNTSSVYR